jgi:hypothetical protein
MGHDPSDDSLAVEAVLHPRLPNGDMASSTLDATNEAARVSHSLPLSERWSSEGRRGSVLADAAGVNTLRTAAGVEVAAVSPRPVLGANREATTAADMDLAGAHSGDEPTTWVCSPPAVAAKAALVRGGVACIVAGTPQAAREVIGIDRATAWVGVDDPGGLGVRRIGDKQMALAAAM